MLKYVDVKEVFAEIPNEITLAISISQCPMRCKGCHSQYLWEDIGDELNTESLGALLSGHSGITCVCFMGGDNDPAQVDVLSAWVKENHPRVRTAWYSGRDTIAPQIHLKNLDYIKIGRWDETKGPLTNPQTNQTLYRVDRAVNGESVLTDITPKFWNRI